MTFQLVLFYIFAAIILYGALQTVTAKNPVHATLHLVLTFCVSAMMWLLMQAEFLGITLVVVYVGAVMVLFLFVIMMLNIDIEEMRKGFWRHAPAAMTVGVLMAALLIAIFVAPDTNLSVLNKEINIAADYSNVRDLGMQLYTTYLLQFELAAVLLVLGMVAAIALVHRKSTNPKYINPADQVKVNAAEGRLRMVKMQSEVQTPKATQPEHTEESQS
ncbi:NADH-quinone oxidoreductase subunit J [Neisseriaceae bacterium B1]